MADLGTWHNAIDKRTRTATILLNISKSDLEASKYLLEGKHYCQSVFYLEQSIEIALKSWAIWHEIKQIKYGRF